MTQPHISFQTTEASGLSGAGPHLAPCEIVLPAEITGSAFVLLTVHDSGTPKTLRMSALAKVDFSDGAIVNTSLVAPTYRELAWMLVADPAFAIDGGDLVAMFDGILGADVEAATVTYLVTT